MACYPLTAEILEFPAQESPRLLFCDCKSDAFRLLEDWTVRCALCDEIVGFWNPIQPIDDGPA